MQTRGYVTGQPLRVLRLEGLAVLVCAVLIYREFGGGWGTFALAFLLPDVAMLGYLAGPRVGAACYNAAHTYVGPALVWLVGDATGMALGPLAALIWTAHIGFDRMLGYGLKHPSAFTDTHLGPIGPARRAAN